MLTLLPCALPFCLHRRPFPPAFHSSHSPLPIPTCILPASAAGPADFSIRCFKPRRASGRMRESALQPNKNNSPRLASPRSPDSEGWKKLRTFHDAGVSPTLTLSNATGHPVAISLLPLRSRAQSNGSWQPNPSRGEPFLMQELLGGWSVSGVHLHNP